MSLTISDLANILELSTATVSKALNDYDEIPLITRERVLAAAKKYNYQPSNVARNLRLKITGRIGLINLTSTLTDDYFIRILKGTAFQAEKEGYSLVLYTSFQEKPDTLIRACHSKEVDGLVLMGGGNVDEIIPSIVKSNMPFILVGRRTSLKDVSFISPDDELGVFQAVNHLIQVGHKDIAFIGQEEDVITNTSRLKGFKHAMSTSGLAVRKNWIVSAPRHATGGYLAMKELFNNKSKPTAVFCYSDGIAIEALQYLNEQRIRVPEDLAIVSCDNIYLSQSAQPPLTTIDIPLEKIGQLAISFLLKKIKNPDVPVLQECVPGKLIVRKSSYQLKNRE